MLTTLPAVDHPLVFHFSQTLLQMIFQLHSLNISILSYHLLFMLTIRNHHLNWLLCCLLTLWVNNCPISPNIENWIWSQLPHSIGEQNELCISLALQPVYRPFLPRVLLTWSTPGLHLRHPQTLPHLVTAHLRLKTSLLSLKLRYSPERLPNR